MAVLGHQQRARPDLLHGGQQGGRHLGVEVVGGVASGHVGHVDAPAVQLEGRPQPAAGHRPRALQEPAAQLGRVVAELGQRAVAEPALVGVVVGAGEIEELALGRPHVGQGAPEPGVGVAAVVGRQVAHQVPAAGVDLGRQPGRGLVAAEQRVDLVEAGGVVAVIGLGREERGQVEGVDADVGQVVEALGDAVQVAPGQLHPAPGPRRATGSSQAAGPGGGLGPGGTGRPSAAAERAKRSGKIW